MKEKTIFLIMFLYLSMLFAPIAQAHDIGTKHEHWVPAHEQGKWSEEMRILYKVNKQQKATDLKGEATTRTDFTKVREAFPEEQMGRNTIKDYHNKGGYPFNWKLRESER
jgi:hypothetical protein